MQHRAKPRRRRATARQRKSADRRIRRSERRPRSGLAARTPRAVRADRLGVARLDEASRTVVVLRYYENLSSADIAELVGATPAAVDMRLSRARRTLRELLG